MKRRMIKRRNPMAAVVRKLRPKRIASAKAYRRTEKHKDRSHLIKWDGPFSYAGCSVNYSAASRCFMMTPRISRAAVGMCVPGPKMPTTPLAFRNS